MHLPCTTSVRQVMAALVLVTVATTGCSRVDHDAGSPAERTPLPGTSTQPVTATSLPGPYIAGATWEVTELGPTLAVTPTLAGRNTPGIDDGITAWHEVIARAPDADTPGMWEQFECHWRWARHLRPDKATWNIEPWRPVVAADQMITAGCNPGGPEI